MTNIEPSIAQTVSLNFVGDWGQANFHRICSWLTQEFCDRAGKRSRVAIWSMRDGGLESIRMVRDGEAHLSIATPAMLVSQAATGQGFFAPVGPFPGLRALAVLPQNDSLVLAVAPRFGISSFADLHAKKPPLRLAVSVDDGTNFIGHVSRLYLAAHGLDEETLRGWGGELVTATRPEQSLVKMERGDVDAVLQEAIMTPGWVNVMRDAIALPAETKALELLERNHGFRRNRVRSGFWEGLSADLPTLDFSDFVVLVRDDLPDEIAHLLTWCLVETREAIERQYRHIPAERSPLSYPLSPQKMAQTPLPLHPGAHRYYVEAGHLS